MPLSMPNGHEPFGEAYIKQVHQAVQRAYRRYGHKPRRDEIEDISQTICLSLMKNGRRGFNSFDPRKGKITTWLQKIANNAVLHHLRKPETNQSLEELGVNSFVYSPTQEMSLLCEERKDVLRSVSGSLEPHRKQLLEFLLEDGMSDVEKARRMGISSNVFRKRKHDFLEKLRGMIEIIEETKHNHYGASKEIKKKRGRR